MAVLLVATLLGNGSMCGEVLLELVEAEKRGLLTNTELVEIYSGCKQMEDARSPQ